MPTPGIEFHRRHHVLRGVMRVARVVGEATWRSAKEAASVGPE